MSYPVEVKLHTDNIFDIEERIEEVKEIRDWVHELVQDDSKYDIKYMATSECLKIWFDDEKHAMLCALRWL